MSTDGEVTSLESSLYWNLGIGLGSILCFSLGISTNLSFLVIGRFLALTWIAVCMYAPLRDAGIKGLASILFWLTIFMPGCWMVLSFLSSKSAEKMLAISLLLLALSSVIQVLNWLYVCFVRRRRNSL